MRISELVCYEKQEVVGATCDVCKTSYNKQQDPNDVLELQEFVYIDFVGGYGSVFGDMDRHQLDVCQHCLKKAFGQFFRSADATDELYEGLDRKLIEDFGSDHQEQFARGTTVSSFQWIEEADMSNDDKIVYRQAQQLANEAGERVAQAVRDLPHNYVIADVDGKAQAQIHDKDTGEILEVQIDGKWVKK